MRRISVAQGLMELKTLNSRINKAQEGAIFIAAVDPARRLAPKNLNDAEPTFQKVMDLIENRRALKEAIVQSNAETIVQIGDEKMTVAAAIERKVSISFDENFLRLLQMQKADAERTRLARNEAALKEAHRLAGEVYKNGGNDNAEQKAAFIANQLKQNEWTVLDPMQIDLKIKALENMVTTFRDNVDLVLTTSNVNTFIEVA